jgi:hypothetical protein
MSMSAAPKEQQVDAHKQAKRQLNNHLSIFRSYRCRRANPYQGFVQYQFDVATFVVNSADFVTHDTCFGLRSCGESTIASAETAASKGPKHGLSKRQSRHRQAGKKLR